jgi:hypothetical protein
VQILSVDARTAAVRMVSTLGMDVGLLTPSSPGLRFTLAPYGKSSLARVRRERIGHLDSPTFRAEARRIRPALPCVKDRR